MTVKGNTLDPCCDETLLYLDCGDDDKVHMWKSSKELNTHTHKHTLKSIHADSAKSEYL